MIRALLLYFCAFSLYAADVYRLAGTVINAATNAPFARAHVFVTRTGSNRAVASLVTGDNGQFAFDLPEGKYNLRAGTRDSTQNFGMSRPDSTVGSAMFVGPKLDTSQLTFRWFPPAAIGGKVLDGNAEPVENALIQLVRSSINGGRRVVATAGWAYTNDLGEYRFGPIPAGSYYLTASGEPWYIDRSPPVNQAGPRPPSYRTVHYPNSFEASRATALQVKLGEEARADFALTEAPGANVTVNYNAVPNFQGTVSLIAEGIGTTEAFQREKWTFGRQHILKGVPAGHYTVEITGSSGNTSVAGRKDIDVNGTDTSIEVNVRPAATVSGRVDFPSSGSRPSGSILVSLVHEGTPGTISTAVRADGSYAFPAAASGKYRVALRASGYFASEVKVQGTEYRDGVISLDNGDTANVSIVASDEMGSVKGILTQTEKPVAGAMVVLTPATESADRTLYRGFRTDSDGSFDFQNVRTGDYLLFVSPDPDLEYTSAAAVKPFLRHAKPVRVTKKTAATENLSIP